MKCCHLNRALPLFGFRENPTCTPSPARSLRRAPVPFLVRASILVSSMVSVPTVAFAPAPDSAMETALVEDWTRQTTGERCECGATATIQPSQRRYKSISKPPRGWSGSRSVATCARTTAWCSAKSRRIRRSSRYRSIRMTRSRHRRRSSGRYAFEKTANAEARRTRTYARGRRTVKRLPVPSRDSAVTRPP